MESIVFAGKGFAQLFGEGRTTVYVKLAGTLHLWRLVAFSLMYSYLEWLVFPEVPNPLA
jgi:hypothetical protein